jgi:tRNA(Leu) C34 or U34 (ribose-2'-O)-methylase TrmL
MENGVKQRVMDLIDIKADSVYGFAKQINVAQTTISEYLNNGKKVSFTIIRAILDSFPDVSAEWLLRGTGNSCFIEERDNIDIVRGTDKWIDIHHHASTADALAHLKSEGYRIIATTPHRESCTPESFDVTKGKFAIVMGTEKTGISDEVMAAADEFLRIPMCGMVESLNVSACAAIIVYMLSERMRHSVENWQLTEEEQTETLYKWLVDTVKDAEPLLKRGGFL